MVFGDGEGGPKDFPSSAPEEELPLSVDNGGVKGAVAAVM